MFFETKHSISENEFTLFNTAYIDFPLHIHRSFEYFEQICGSTEVTVDGTKYLLTEGEAVLIFPLQSHSYATVNKGSIQICIFSPDIVNDFYRIIENKTPKDNKFKCVLPLCADFENLFQKKSIAYFICGEFEKDSKYIEMSGKNDNQILVSLLLFADKNFKSKCLLRDAASTIGYDYAYVSKLFKRKAGISFRQYVNNLRIIESKQLLRSDAKSIEEIAEACGFSSLRTFDREFKSQNGISPSEYKKKK